MSHFDTIRAALLAAEAEYAAVLQANTDQGVAIVALKAQVADLKAQLAALTPQPPATTMKYGMGGTADPFDATAAAQIRDLNAKCIYVYWPPGGANPTWQRNCAALPEHIDIILQLKATTRAEYDATFASFPANRTGKVYVHHWNEPEDQVESGQFTLQQWQSRTDAMYAAIDAAKRPYLVKSVEFMDWTLVLFNKGGATAARTPSNYIRPGCQHIGLSVYAGVKIVDNHAVPKMIPAEQAKMCGDFAKSKGLPWSNAAGGMAIPTTHASDPISAQNRATWFKASAAACEANGAKHYNWFDLKWADGSYAINSDPTLKAAWLSLAKP